jgi:hypothetical protein
VRTGDLGEEELAAEFDSLLEIDKVRNVRVTDRELIVETNAIFCTDSRTGNVHRIGEFHVHLPFIGDGFKFLNQTGRIHTGSQYQHAPHVGENGWPCLGNIKDLLPGMIQRRELVPAVQLCIAFLESANTDDAWGSKVEQWPVEGRDPNVRTRIRNPGTVRLRERPDEPQWRPGRDRGYQY